MTAILHVVQAGHRCRNPLKDTSARRVQLGSQLRKGNWILFCRYSQEFGARKTNIRYIVRHYNFTDEYYEFTNFNCAAAKLAELGGVN